VPNAIRDENHVPVMLMVSSVDGTTPVPAMVNAVTGRLLIKESDAETAPDPAHPSNAIRDDNRKPAILAASSSDDITPVPLLIVSNLLAVNPT